MLIDDPKEIKKIRKQLNLSQSKLAKLAKVSQSLIAKIESGRIDPTYSKLKRITTTLQQYIKPQQVKAKNIMLKKVIAVKPHQSVNEAIQLMRKHAISQLPVMQYSTVIGLISETDVLDNLDKNLKHLKNREVMKEAPPIINEETNAETITQLLHYTPLVLVAKKGIITGIITKADLLKMVK